MLSRGVVAFGATALPLLAPSLSSAGSRLFVCVFSACVRVYIEVCALRVDPTGRLRVVPQRTVGALSFFLFFHKASAVADDAVVVFVAFDESSSRDLPSLSHYLPALNAPSTPTRRSRRRTRVSLSRRLSCRELREFALLLSSAPRARCCLFIRLS